MNLDEQCGLDLWSITEASSEARMTVNILGDLIFDFRKGGGGKRYKFVAVITSRTVCTFSECSLGLASLLQKCTCKFALN